MLDRLGLPPLVLGDVLLVMFTGNYFQNIILIADKLCQVFQKLYDLLCILGAEPHLGDDLRDLDHQPGQVDAAIDQGRLQVQGLRDKFL